MLVVVKIYQLFLIYQCIKTFAMNSKSSRSKCNPAVVANNRHHYESLANSCFPINQGPSASRLHELFCASFVMLTHALGKVNPFLKEAGIKQINKPMPVSLDDMETIFHEAKDAQEKADQAFEEEQQREGTLKSENVNAESNTISSVVTKSVMNSKTKRKSDKASTKRNKLPAPGSTVRVVSGTFAEYVGSLKKVNRKTRKATVGFTLFGKESLVDLDLSEIVPETN